MMHTDRFPAMMRAMAAGGATGCLPSVGMFRPPEYTAYLEAVARYQAAPAPGCEALGAHFESPYLNPDCICIEPEFLWAPRPDEYRRWLEAAPSALRMITLAPELPGAFELIQALSARGAAASISPALPKGLAGSGNPAPSIDRGGRLCRELGS